LSKIFQEMRSRVDYETMFFSTLTLKYLLLITGEENSFNSFEAELPLSLQPISCPPNLRPGGMRAVQFFSNDYLIMDDQKYGINSMCVWTGDAKHHNVRKGKTTGRNFGTDAVQDCEIGDDDMVQSIAVEADPSKSLKMVVYMKRTCIIVAAEDQEGPNQTKSLGKSSARQRQYFRWNCPDLDDCTPKLIIVSGKILITHLTMNAILCYDKTGKCLFRRDLSKGFNPRGLVKYGDTSIIVTGDGGVGKLTYPEFEPVWHTRLKGATGVCVDDQGLIYVGAWSEKKIFILTSSGESAKWFPQ